MNSLEKNDKVLIRTSSLLFTPRFTFSQIQISKFINLDKDVAIN
jgi:hypothetical protein